MRIFLTSGPLCARRPHRVEHKRRLESKTPAFGLDGGGGPGEQGQDSEGAVPERASWTKRFLLGIQVLFKFFKFFSKVWYVIILSQTHSSQVAKSKSKQELEHDVGKGGKSGGGSSVGRYYAAFPGARGGTRRQLV